MDGVFDTVCHCLVGPMCKSFFFYEKKSSSNQRKGSRGAQAPRTPASSPRRPRPAWCPHTRPPRHSPPASISPHPGRELAPRPHTTPRRLTRALLALGGSSCHAPNVSQRPVENEDAACGRRAATSPALESRPFTHISHPNGAAAQEAKRRAACRPWPHCRLKHHKAAPLVAHGHTAGSSNKVLRLSSAIAYGRAAESETAEVERMHTGTIPSPQFEGTGVRRILRPYSLWRLTHPHMTPNQTLLN